jgi:DNA-binding MarR family transcriptional regulator
MSILHVYSPARRSPEELESTFVARHELLEELLSHLGGQWTRDSHQHVLLVGPRGIGKSHMLAMMDMEIERNPEAHGHWLRVWFPQEGYGILRLEQWVAQWARGAVAAIRKEGGDTAALERSLAGLKERKSANGGLTSEILAVLRSWANEHGRRYLLLAENLDRLFGKRLLKQREQQKRLRALLSHDPSFLLLGTSPTVFHQLTEGAEPMYELMQIRRLEGLTCDEMIDLLRRRAKYDLSQGTLEVHARRVLAVVERQKGRLATLYDLTDGNPRFSEMLYRIICSAREITSVEDEFFRLLEELTPYFQHRTSELSEQQEEILLSIARAGYKITPSRIAEEIRAPLNSVTRQLGRLEDDGFVMSVGRRGKSGLYALREKLFRYWLQYHEEATEPLVRLIVDFLAAWYDRDELQREMDNLGNTIARCDPGKEKTHIIRRHSYLCAAVEVQSRAADRQSLLKEVPSLDELLLQVTMAGDDESMAAVEEVIGPRRHSAYALTEVGNSLLWRYQRTADEATFDRAHDLLTRATEVAPEAPLGWDRLGVLYAIKWESSMLDACFDKSIHYFNRAIKENSRFLLSWYNLGVLHGKLWHFNKLPIHHSLANECYKMAVSIDNKYLRAWYGWAVLAKNASTANGSVTDIELARESCERYSKFMKLTEGNADVILYRAHAASSLVLLSLDPYDTLTWMHTWKEVLATASIDEKVQSVIISLNDLARAVPAKEILDALLDVAGSDIQIFKKSKLAPYLDALRVLTGEDVSLLDRQPPEVLTVLKTVFPDLPVGTPAITV